MINSEGCFYPVTHRKETQKLTDLNLMTTCHFHSADVTYV